MNTTDRVGSIELPSVTVSVTGDHDDAEVRFDSFERLDSFKMNERFADPPDLGQLRPVPKGF